MKQITIFLTILFILSYLLTWITRSIALRKKILDIPNERSSHLIPTPRGGGIAIVVTWYIGISFLFFSNYLDRELYFALLAGIILAGVSLLDDIISLKPLLRMIFQVLTAIIAFYFLGGLKPVFLFNEVSIPSVILYPVAIIGIVWFINLYNFLDGIDGYASIEAITICAAFFLITGNVINALLIASVLGFLIWNWPRAKIFMGDVGSTQLGFIIIVLGIYFHNQEQLSIIWWLVLTSPFWFDATLTLFRRWRNKEKLSQAHRKHIYQRLVQSGYSHLKVDIYLILINILLIIMVYFCHEYQYLQIPALLFSVGLLYFILRFTDKRKPFPRD
jgi:UDP-N-acetylmuramyl pentapeptide phosphotransferase/UDP-N-acetylglucosamine-1-phosphate transferase